jgi:hypothetical protein
MPLELVAAPNAERGCPRRPTARDHHRADHHTQAACTAPERYVFIYPVCTPGPSSDLAAHMSAARAQLKRLLERGFDDGKRRPRGDEMRWSLRAALARRRSAPLSRIAAALWD